MPVEAIHLRVGKNLRRARQERQLSLDKAAEVTGVSKGMLHQIERGDAQPTVTTLWKIATGFNMSFSALLKEDRATVLVAAPREVPDITEDDGKCQVYVIFPFDPETQTELFLITLSPTCNYLSSPHRAGVREFITVVSGVLTMEINDEPYPLPARHAIRFAGDVSHRYCNRGDTDVVMHVIMHYGEP